MEPPVKALCVAPFGMEEGTQAEVPPQEFGLVVGEPTRFRFFSSSVRRDDAVGVMLDDPSASDEFDEVSPIETPLTAGTNEGGKLIPVNLRAAVTETGTPNMPWGEAPKAVVGEFARWQGARVPSRLVSSAKSWLCHPGVDRSAPILPWGAPADVAKVSPTEASSLLLRHMSDAWNTANP